MKSIINHILIMPLIIVSSCGLLDSGEYIEDFFPLEVGNKWYYAEKIYQDVEKFDSKWVVINKVNINEKEYFEVLKESSYHVDTAYFRKENYKVIELHKNKSKNNLYVESIFADFKMEYDDTVKYFNEFGSGRYYDVTFKKNIAANEITLFYDDPRSADEEYLITFKRDIGIFEFYSVAWGIHEYLISYDLK